MVAHFPAETLSIHSPELFRAAVRRAAEVLRAGEPVALPTETVYGLAANALDADAVAAIYRIKGRPAHNPIIVHVADAAQARACAADWPKAANDLAKAFWPGPLTLVLPRSERIPDIVTAGGATVGIRWPSHPFIQAVIRECGFPLAAPSANPAGCVSPTQAAHVRSQLGDKVRLIIDGGASQVGIESTVVDLTTTPPAVLRPGMIHEPSLQAVLGRITPAGAVVSSGLALRSPGLLLRHYAPRARLIVARWNSEAELADVSSGARCEPRKTHVIAYRCIPAAGGFGRVSVVPQDPEAYARALYAELHQADEAGAEQILVEAPPEGPEWNAIADRLQRASAS
jgi:L-threonylcarbamoyladenylate synthase